MHPTARNVRVHSCTANVLAQAIHNQEIHVVERQFGHQSFGFPKQFGFALLEIRGLEHSQASGLMGLILHNGQAGQYGR